MKYSPHFAEIEQSTPEPFLFLQRHDAPSINEGTRTNPGTSVDAAGGWHLSCTCPPTDAYKAEDKEELEATLEA